eukprot:scaffold848_cov247-Pinguiococcus_pyrenoidosus.AAC.8
MLLPVSVGLSWSTPCAKVPIVKQSFVGRSVSCLAFEAFLSAASLASARMVLLHHQDLISVLNAGVLESLFRHVAPPNKGLVAGVHDFALSYELSTPSVHAHVPRDAGHGVRHDAQVHTRMSDEFSAQNGLFHATLRQLELSRAGLETEEFQFGHRESAKARGRRRCLARIRTAEKCGSGLWRWTRFHPFEAARFNGENTSLAQKSMVLSIYINQWEAAIVVSSTISPTTTAYGEWFALSIRQAREDSITKDLEKVTNNLHRSSALRRCCHRRRGFLAHFSRSLLQIRRVWKQSSSVLLLRRATVKNDRAGKGGRDQGGDQKKREAAKHQRPSKTALLSRDSQQTLKILCGPPGFQTQSKGVELRHRQTSLEDAMLAT